MSCSTATMHHDTPDSVIPAKAPRRKYPLGAGIQRCTTGPALPSVGFRGKPGMTWILTLLLTLLCLTASAFAATDGKAVVADITRRHDIREHTGSDGLYTLVGGKLTTFRQVGEEVGDLLMKRFGLKRKSVTHSLPLPGGGQPDAARLRAAIAGSGWGATKIQARRPA